MVFVSSETNEMPVISTHFFVSFNELYLFISKKILKFYCSIYSASTIVNKQIFFDYKYPIHYGLYIKNEDNVCLKKGNNLMHNFQTQIQTYLSIFHIEEKPFFEIAIEFQNSRNVRKYENDKLRTCSRTLK